MKLIHRRRGEFNMMKNGIVSILLSSEEQKSEKKRIEKNVYLQH